MLSSAINTAQRVVVKRINNDMNDFTDNDNRTLMQELNLLHKANAATLRELNAIRMEQAHSRDILTATRRELAEQRILIKQSDDTRNGVQPSVTRLISTKPHVPPRATVFEKSTPRIFAGGREIIGNKIEHVIRARDMSGKLIELPCSYDMAHRFISMERVNRRTYWRGSTNDYSAMLALCLSLNLCERVGRGYRWTERYTPMARVGWLSQFRPPNRTR